MLSIVSEDRGLATGVSSDEVTTLLQARVRELEERLAADAQSLHTYEARFRALQDLSIAAIFVLRIVRDGRTQIRDLKILDLNETALELLGGSRAEMLGGSVFCGVIGDSEFARGLMEVARDGASTTFDVHLARDSSGLERVHVLGRAARIDAETVTLTVVDLTERDALHARAALTDRLVCLGRLVAGVAHEFNNPLTWIISTLEHIRTTLRDRAPDMLEPIDQALEGTARLRRIVADMRSGIGPTLSGAAVEIGPAIESALRMASHAIKPRARAVSEVEPDLPRVVADPARLAQVILNLVLNASEACVGPAPGRMSVSARRRGTEHVALIVKDNGCGMEEAVVRRALEPFFTTRAGKGGTGLGLWICQSIVETFGGTLTIRSVLGQGTEVEVLLPVLRPIELPDPEPSHLPESASSLPTQELRPVPESAPDRLRVLVVDDEPLVALALKRLLAKLHDVVVEHAPARALDRIAAGERFDVILSDLTMPEMDGVDFFVTAETLDEGLAGRVIIVTGGTSPEIAAGVRDRGLELLEKPFDGERIRRTVGKIRRRSDL